MPEQSSSNKRKASDSDFSPEKKAQPSPCQSGTRTVTQSRELDTQGGSSNSAASGARLKDAKSGLQNAPELLTKQLSPTSPSSGPPLSSSMKELIFRYRDAEHHNLEDFGYFVDSGRVKPIMDFLESLPVTWHRAFRRVPDRLERALKEWPYKLMPAQSIISPLRDVFDEVERDLNSIKSFRNGMFEQSPLQWWIEVEHDITFKLPDILADLAGFYAEEFNDTDKDGYDIVDVLRGLAQSEEFNLPQNILTTLEDNNSEPSLELDELDVFDIKMEAVRRQIVNVSLKYQRFHGVIKPLKELLEKLEDEVECHKRSISNNA